MNVSVHVKMDHTLKAIVDIASEELPGYANSSEFIREAILDKLKASFPHIGGELDEVSTRSRIGRPPGSTNKSKAAPC